MGEECLFVGGPWDGRRVMVSATLDRVYLPPDDGNPAWAERLWIGEGERRVFYWRELPFESVLAALIDGYRGPLPDDESGRRAKSLCELLTCGAGDQLAELGQKEMSNACHDAAKRILELEPIVAYFLRRDWAITSQAGIDFRVYAEAILRQIARNLNLSPAMVRGEPGGTLRPLTGQERESVENSALVMRMRTPEAIQIRPDEASTLADLLDDESPR